MGGLSHAEFALTDESGTVEYTIVLSDGRVAADCLVFKDANGSPALAELRLRIVDPEQARYGISMRLLRGLSLDELLRPVREELAQLEAEPLWEEAAQTWWSYLRQQPTAGRKRLPSECYALVAAAYVRAVAHGSRQPVVDIAEEMQISRGRARDLVHEARRQDILTRAGRGRVGGELTPRARAILGQIRRGRRQ